MAMISGQVRLTVVEGKFSMYRLHTYVPVQVPCGTKVLFNRYTFVSIGNAMAWFTVLEDVSNILKKGDVLRLEQGKVSEVFGS